MTTTPRTRRTIPQQPRGTSAAGSRGTPGPRGHVGWIVFGSLVTGLVAALLAVFVPFVPVRESALAGAVLCGFALGWVMLAVLSVRFTDQPQRWAWGPALFLGVGGLLLLGFGGSVVDDVLGWVWPPALLALTVWMSLRVHRDLRSAVGRWLLYPVFAVTGLVAIGGGYEAVRAATTVDVEMPGQLVDVGDHTLHLKCSGSGSPTVVLEPGAGGMSSTMGWISPAVAAETTVCVYDRAGRGWSEPADKPQDAAQVATDLHTLLQRANVPGPYVLAGHSFGGLYVLTFADQYPDDVAGLALIDSTAPAESPGARPPSPPTATDASGRLSTLFSSVSRLGLTRLYAGSDFGSMPPGSRDELRAKVAEAGFLRTTLDEYFQAGASGREAAALTDFGDKPLFVLTAGAGSQPGWMDDQNELAALSTNSAHDVVEGAAHFDLLGEEGPAAETAQAVLDVVSAVRDDRSLR